MSITTHHTLQEINNSNDLLVYCPVIQNCPHNMIFRPVKKVSKKFGKTLAWILRHGLNKFVFFRMRLLKYNDHGFISCRHLFYSHTLEGNIYFADVSSFNTFINMLLTKTVFSDKFRFTMNYKEGEWFIRAN